MNSNVVLPNAVQNDDSPIMIANSSKRVIERAASNRDSTKLEQPGKNVAQSSDAYRPSTAPGQSDKMPISNDPQILQRPSTSGPTLMAFSRGRGGLKYKEQPTIPETEEQQDVGPAQKPEKPEKPAAVIETPHQISDRKLRITSAADNAPKVVVKSSKRHLHKQQETIREVDDTLARPGAAKYSCCKRNHKWPAPCVSCAILVKTGVLDPDSDFSLLWDCVYIVLLLFCVLWTPYEAAFISEINVKISHTSENAAFIANRCVDALFMVDMVLRFITMRLDQQGKLVSNRKALAYAYVCKGYFLRDTITIIPFDAIGFALKDAIIARFHMLRMLRLIGCWQRLQHLRNSWYFRSVRANVDVSYTFTVVLRLFGMFAVAAHWMACLYRFTLESEPYSTYNWLAQAFDLQPLMVSGSVKAADLVPAAQAWAAALVWSARALTTGGVANSGVQTDAERAVALLALACGVLLITHFIASMLNAGTVKSNVDVQVYGALHQMSALEKRHFIPSALHSSLRRHLHATRAIRTKEEEMALIAALPTSLRRDVLKQLYGDILAHFEVFVAAKFGGNNNADNDGLAAALCEQLEPVVFAPDDLIMRKGTPPDTLMVICSGLASKSGRLYRKSAVMGHDIVLSIAKITDDTASIDRNTDEQTAKDPSTDLCSRAYDVRALTTVVALRLTSEKLAAVLKHAKYTTLKHSFRRMATRLLFLRNFMRYSKLLRVMRMIIPTFTIDSVAHAYLLEDCIGGNWDRMLERISTAARVVSKHVEELKLASPPIVVTQQQLSRGKEFHHSIAQLAFEANPHAELHEGLAVEKYLDMKTRFQLGDLVRQVATELGLEMETPWLVNGQPFQLVDDGTSLKDAVVIQRHVRLEGSDIPAKTNASKVSTQKPVPPSQTALTPNKSFTGTPALGVVPHTCTVPSKFASKMEEALRHVGKELTGMRHNIRSTINSNVVAVHALDVKVTSMSTTVERLVSEVQAMRAVVEAREAVRKSEELKIPPALQNVIDGMQVSARWMITIGILACVFLFIQFVLVISLVTK